MVLNATFNNISVLLVEKTTDKLYHIMLYTSVTLIEIQTNNISGDRH